MLTTPTNPPRQAVALHEAGHAVAALLVGNTISHASIEGFVVHHCVERARTPAELQAHVEDQIFVAWAGCIAEMMYWRRHPGPIPDLTSHFQDERDARAWARRVTSDPATEQKLLERARERCLYFVATRQAAIENVARRLAQSGALSQAELEEAIANA